MRIIAFCSKDIKSLWKRRRGVNYIFPGKTREPAEELNRERSPREAGGERGGLLRSLWPGGSGGGQPRVLGAGWGGLKK